MFAKFRTYVLYPEIAYCAWLGILPALIFEGIINIVLLELYGSIDWFESLAFYAGALILPGLIGIMIGATGQVLRRNCDFDWIWLSFLVPLLTSVVCLLFDLHWDLQSLVCDGFYVSAILGLSLCSSVTAILLRTFFSRTKPTLPPVVAEFSV